MNTFKLLTLMLLSVLIYSCSESNQIEDKSENQKSIDRIRIDDKTTLVSESIIDANGEIKLAFTKVSSIPSDQYALIDYTVDQKHKEGTDLFFIPISSNMKDVPDPILLHGTGTSISYSCECKEPVEQSDCVQRKYHNRVYCDGNFCQSCSLVINAITADEDDTNLYNSGILFSSSNN